MAVLTRAQSVYLEGPTCVCLEWFNFCSCAQGSTSVCLGVQLRVCLELPNSVVVLTKAQVSVCRVQFRVWGRIQIWWKCLPKHFVSAGGFLGSRQSTMALRVYLNWPKFLCSPSTSDCLEGPIRVCLSWSQICGCAHQSTGVCLEGPTCVCLEWPNFCSCAYWSTSVCLGSNSVSA